MASRGPQDAFTVRPARRGDKPAAHLY